MKPTVLYWPLIKKIKDIKGVKACAHITGGGMDNILRVLPKGSHAVIKDWKWSDLLEEASKRSALSKEDMLKTFNCGVGMILAVSQDSFEEVKSNIEPEFTFVSEGLVEINEGSESKWTVEG